MKIAYFTNQYPGISHSFIRREILALERLGHNVARFAIRPSKDVVIANEDLAEAEKTRHIVTAGPLVLLGLMARRLFRNPAGVFGAFIEAVRLGAGSSAGLFRHFLYFGEALVLAEWLEEAGVGHVHAHFGTNATTIALLAGRVGKVSFSFTAHGPEEFERADDLSLRDKVIASAFVVAISHYGAAQLKKLTPPDHWHKIKIVHCGIEASFYDHDQVEVQPDPNRFVCVGRLCAEKGQLDLVEAVAHVAQDFPDIQVDLIGDGPMRANIEERIRHLGVEKSVNLLGWKTPAEVREAILGAHAFVLPSYAEGLPVSIMEAMTLSRPVITTYVAGIPELVINGECGWVFPAGDVDMLASCLREAIGQEKAARANFVEIGRQRALLRHNIDTEAAKLASSFEEFATRG